MINQTSSKRYFRSVDELHESSELKRVIDHDFAAAAPAPQDGLSRRRWLQLMGASLAFGSVAGCRYPDEIIAPFAFRPQGRMPGIPDDYATMWELGGVARPTLAVSYDGRPIKLDGNPDHPDSNGASDVFTQASILGLYDPDRSRSPAKRVDDSLQDCDWEQAIAALKTHFSGTGAGVAILSEPSSSPSLARLKAELLQRQPDTKWYEFTSISSDYQVAGSKMAFGEPYDCVYELAGAKVIVAVDADFLGTDVSSTRYARDFSTGRDADDKKMNRLYSVESNFSTTGAMADHRLPVRSAQIGSFLANLEQAVDAHLAGSATAPGSSYQEKTLDAMAEDLANNAGSSVVMVGWNQPKEVHARAFRLNSKLNNIGQTVKLVERSPEPVFRSGVDQLEDLSKAIDGGNVTTLLIIGGNPVFYAPFNLDFGAKLQSVKNTFHLGLYRDETARVCGWHLNAAHWLECWGDGLSLDGSICLGQPLLNPLYQGRSAIELLAGLAEPEQRQKASETDDLSQEAHPTPNVGLVVVKETQASHFGGDDPEAGWAKALHDGFIAETAKPSAKPAIQPMNLTDSVNGWKQPWDGEPELVFAVSSATYDGRFANIGWLQELPNFVTKLTWDNAALVSPETAERLGLAHGKIATLQVGEQSIRLPVFLVPGIAAGTICTQLGYGRTAAGRVAGDGDIQVASVGADIRPLRTSSNWWLVPSVNTVATSTSFQLASTQEHFTMDAVGRNEINRRMAPGGDLIREGTFDSFAEFLEQHPIDEHGHDVTADDGGGEEAHHASWPEGHHLHFENFELTKASYKDNVVPHKWGMSIDLNKCTGCNACVIACQAENNIPVVGKDQVRRGREMQWMRIDRYFITDDGNNDETNPHVAHQPVTCQQCENAPCETVCPVAATTHSEEGLNDMVYNRCIGTRYCGNNCPYKVRRFNYYNFTDAQTFLKIPGADRLKKPDLSLQNLVMNPEVWIRSRGVMEKCTYCVQRIQNTKIKAKTEGNRPIGPNEISTACQDVCPTDAIVFGDIQNVESDVHRAHHNPRSYFLLEGLNVLPRTKYLARVRNPHPALVDNQVAGSHANTQGADKKT